MKKLTTYAIGAAATACVMAVIATVGPSVAEPDPHSSPSDASQSATGTAPAPKSAPKSTPTHAPSLAEMDQVRRWANPLANLEDTEGFGRVSLDFTTREVLVQWRGTPPPKVRAAVGAHAHGVRVILEQVKYSQADIIKAGTKLIDLGRHHGEIPVQFVYPTDRMDAMIAAVSPADLARLSTTLAPGHGELDLSETKTRVAAHLADLTGIPVLSVLAEGSVTPQPSPHWLTRARTSDSPSPAAEA